jgi:hypothetical protein
MGAHRVATCARVANEFRGSSLTMCSDRPVSVFPHSFHGTAERPTGTHRDHL